MIAGLPVRKKLNDGNGNRRHKQDVYKTTLPQAELKYHPNDEQNGSCWPHNLVLTSLNRNAWYLVWFVDRFYVRTEAIHENTRNFVRYHNTLC